MSRSLENIFDRLANGWRWDTTSGNTWNGSTGVNVSPVTGVSGLWHGSTSTGIGTVAQDLSSKSKIILPGPDADIVIGDISLVDLLKTIQQRLNILQPNTKLEAQWSQLRELGNQYRELEAQLLEQMAMWNKLKAMPPPVID